MATNRYSDRIFPIKTVDALYDIYDFVNSFAVANATTDVGSNIFNTFTINAPKTVKFTASTNTTVNSLVATGTLGNKITLASVTPGSWWQITDADGGTNINDYLDVTDSHGHPDSTFYYGANGSGDAYSIANGWGISATTRRIYMFN
jgi:hypothetical protein